MLITLSTTHQPTSDLGFLLHKHPDKIQSVDLGVGKAHVFYPEYTDERIQVALLIDINPIDLVRGKAGSHKNQSNFTLEHYVNDTPYISGSYMSVALSKAFSTAMNGQCRNLPELVEKPMSFEVQLSTLSAPYGGEQIIRTCFEPLGYSIECERHTLDSKNPIWGESRYYNVVLAGTQRLQDLLSHLYLLIPAINNDRHYFIGAGEIEKLMEKGKSWLPEHPARDQIVERYLKNLRGLSSEAITKLDTAKTKEETVSNMDEADAIESANSKEPELQERKQTLHQIRLNLALQEALKSGAHSILDLGCGEGKMLRLLLKEKQFTQILGMDVSYKELVRAKERLYWDEMPPRQKERIELIHGALTYRDHRLDGFDAALVIEVIEHLDENRLGSFERVLFEFARPKTIILSTPNQEYNQLFETLPENAFRHSDHRFEWTRKAFETWAEKVSTQFEYNVRYLAVGEEDPTFGAPSQMAVFTKV